MILVDLLADQQLYRAHTPKWATQPLSGAGAASQGGRFNRPGVPALYLSFELLTAATEYQQGSPLLPPLTMVSYTTNLHTLVDLRQLHRSDVWDDLWQDWREDWRALAFDQHTEPPSWVLSDLARDRGAAGIIFPSQACVGGTNVVVYTDQLGVRGNTLTVNDPQGLLPTTLASWGPSP